MEPAVPHRTAPLFPRDRFFWIGVVVWGASVLPSLIPVLPAEVTFAWADQYSDVPGLIFVLVAAALAIRRASSQRERVFWRLLVGCITGWLAVRGLYLLIPYEEWGTATDLTADLFYLGGYLCVALAVERRPDRHPGTGGPGRLQRAEAAGTLVFAFALLTYLVLLPSVFNPEVYASWVSSLLLFAVLDAFLLARGISLLRGSLEKGWRLPLRWLTAVFAIWLVGDLGEGLMYLDVIPFTEPGTPWDLIWHLPSLALLASVRSRRWYQPPMPPGGHGDPDVMERLTPGGGSPAT